MPLFTCHSAGLQEYDCCFFNHVFRWALQFSLVEYYPYILYAPYPPWRRRRACVGLPVNRLRTAYELNPAAAYLCSGEKFQERIIGFWDFFSLPHKWGTFRDVHGRPQGQSTVSGDIAFHPRWHSPGFNGSVSTVSGRLQRSHAPRCVRNDSWAAIRELALLVNQNHVPTRWK